MTPLVDGNAAAGAMAIPVSLVPPSPRVIALPPLTVFAAPNAPILGTIGDYFACDFANFDRLDDEQRKRCALNLSHLDAVAPLPFTYRDSKSTPFSLFGAHGTFAITPPTELPFDLMSSAIGCSWEVGLCRRQPDKFGLDVDDKKRLTAAAHFDLGKGWSLDAGAQGYMSRYLGGARFILTGGATVSYRW